MVSVSSTSNLSSLCYPRKKGTCPPPRQPCGLTGRESRAHHRGDVPFRSTRSPAWTHVRVGRNVELRAQQSEPTVALARDQSSQWYSARIRLWETARYGLFAAQSPLGAVWHHAVLYGWLGCL